MNDAIVPGQRYLCDSEPELGLGRVTDVDARTLSLEFPAAGVTRRYARLQAPLRRVRHVAGDRVRDETGGAWRIEAVEERDGLCLYTVVAAQGEVRETLCETQLAALPELNLPLQRLLGAHCESGTWFSLRQAALGAAAYIRSSPLLGLVSARTALLPHQLYIAHEVARRPGPRVLLCDEVGLGKTIEAGMILQQQLFNGLASRVLILVPEALLHQWLVELLRRFNLSFTILDQERCEALAEDASANPFESTQLVLCSQGFLAAAPRWQDQALSAPWDLVIVDEAHHLCDSGPASDALLAMVKAFAGRVAGLLLLTATPDSGGWTMLFRLLQVLDPQRFHDQAAFIAEQAQYIALADSVTQLLDDTADLAPLVATLSERFAKDADMQGLLDSLAGRLEPAAHKTARQALVRALLDRHGTGRVMFRNSRRHVGGFPRRELHATLLPLPEHYRRDRLGLYPELALLDDPYWARADPRVQHIERLLQEQRQTKFLLICHEQRSAEALESWFRLQRGVRSAVFHEGMTLLERDRAAAWFAETENGARLLVCSEIGSEGRNFQFVQDLILFDLPADPELLEQRIGRLDRIGQSAAVRIHVPCLEGSPQAVLLRLFDSVLALFRAPNPVAATVCTQLEERLAAALATPADADLCAELLAQAGVLHTQERENSARGRDRLLELNSCPPDAARAIIEQAETSSGAGGPALDRFLDALFASYGLDSEVGESGLWNLRPSDHMLLDHFPQLPDEGLRFTLRRDLALQREDLVFMTWLHPLVLQGIDLVLQGEHGKASFMLLRDKRLPSGTLLLEAVYRPGLDIPRRYQAWRWLENGTLRMVIDEQRREVGKSLPADWLQRQCADADRELLLKVLQARRPRIERLHGWCEQVAARRLQEQMAAATRRMQVGLQEEIDRLRALQRVNPLVPESEIGELQARRSALEAGFARARPQAEALRLLLVV